jgi:2Fe-2S ferredoxin
VPRVTYIHTNGLINEAEAALGETLMQAATNNGIEGIDADCEGAMACGTSHVHVQDPRLAKLPVRSKEEADMLESFASDVRPESL